MTADEILGRIDSAYRKGQSDGLELAANTVARLHGTTFTTEAIEKMLRDAVGMLKINQK